MTPLHHIGEFLRDLLLQFPLPMARSLFVITLAGLFIWVLLLPRSHVTRGENGPASENLKIWAALALFLQILIYIFI
jgi:hypothetical protein